MPTLEEIEAHRPRLLRLARRWQGDFEDMVQETLIWACTERDSFNPTKGSLGGWLYSMLITIKRMHIDAWRAIHPKPTASSTNRKKYDWPKGLTLAQVRATASAAELTAFTAKASGKYSPYQSTRLSTLRKKLCEATWRELK